MMNLLPPRQGTRGGRWFDAALALVLALVGARYVSISDGPVDWLGLPLLVVLAPLPLVLRRRFPVAVLWAVVALALPTGWLSGDIAYWDGVVCLVAIHSAAVHGGHRVATLAALAPAAAGLVVLWTEAKLPEFPNGVIGLLVLAPVLVVAYEIRQWRRRVDEQRKRLVALERERFEALIRAVEHERARIARELHDVVTHNVGVMVIQAGAARKIMDSEPALAREALLAVESGGRAAMTELRQVMGLLTMDSDGHGGPDGPDPTSVDLAPQPGLDRLDALVDGVRRAGLPVELTVQGPPRAVPPAVQLAAYRVVQEALTNVIKHAGGAGGQVRVDVRVEYGVERLHLEISDTGGRPSATAATGNGRGLIGLRERLAVHGGTLETGPRPRGGFRVRALIPLEEA
ncbi:signal transduction histidine kinase [Kitasatospora paracochleata]|uniref:histidine kinase n=2 Tax=Kitasatospora paracochleata TaxID=58354 RepID=A0ABT1J243_9ACTN|nr:signal transduction histidine kinase [Kitasatospora paracochleata]